MLRRHPESEKEPDSRQVRVRPMPNDIYTILSYRIRQAKVNSGLTIEQLAEKAGISSSFLACLIVNKSKPSLETIARIADALNIPANQLFEEIPSGKQPSEKRIADDITRLVMSAKPSHRKIILSTLKELAKSLSANS